MPTTAPAYRLDGASVSRERFYAAACDPHRSVVVEACAGAGKTWMLVSRILRALLDGAQPHEILAITFTRKAAGEMRSRLAEWLAEFAQPACSHERRVQELIARGIEPREAQALAPGLAGLHGRVLKAGRSVEIRTFHSWFSQLLRSAPLELLAELRLQPGMELVEDVSEHESEVFRRFHAAVLSEPTLRADYQALVLRRGRGQLRKWLNAAWERRVEIELADRAGTLDSSVAPARLQWAEYAGMDHPAQRLHSPAADALLRQVAMALGHSDGKLCRQYGQLLAQALALAGAEERLSGVRAALFTHKGEPRKALRAPGLAHAISLIEEVLMACAQQGAHEEHLRMVRLSRVLLAEFEAYKRTRGLADMADLELCALALLRDATLAGWVQERLDTRIRHVLIDEFQDTSPLQWHALHAWLSAYAGAGGGASGQRPPAVFIVGDAKQSIYRFRRAEPRVFDAARKFLVGGLGASVLECDHTRRNATNVLDAINDVFGAAQRDGLFAGFRPHSTEVGALPGAGVFVLSRAPRPSKAEVRVDASHAAWRDTLTVPRHEPEELARRQEAAQVARVALELVARHRVAPGEIQVLCRKRESLRLVAAELGALHLPFAAVEDFSLMESPEVRDLVALLDALASPQHRLSLAHALRSPLFGATDDDLVSLAQAAQPHGGDWWGALTTLESPGAALQRARELLLRWRAAAQRLPPHDVLDLVVGEGEVRERFAVAVPPERRTAALAAIDALLGQALLLDGARHATPYNFVRALKRRAVKVPGAVQPDAVQLLTVHGAKGLEARVVFVMDADPEAPGTETATLLVDWPVEAEHPLRCAFVYAESQCPPSLAPVLAHEQAARRREELNGLYVAMSRARERLFFSATAPHHPVDGVSWWQRLAPRASAWPEVAAAGAAPAHASVSLQRLPVWRGAPAAGASGAPARPVSLNDDAGRLGQAVHRVLEWAASPGRGPVDLALLALSAARDFAVDANEVARLAGRIWGSSACARFFRGEALIWSGNEVPIADRGELLRIDRLVALKEEGRKVWWVLDYKLRHDPQRLAPYREQLLRYRDVIGRLQAGEAVRCAFIAGSGEVYEIE